MRLPTDVRFLIEQVAIVTVQILVLYLISRILFVLVFEVLAMRGKRGGGLHVMLLRLPGNTVHEISHAIGYLVFGYRVAELAPCISDQRGRGYCKVGKAWCPLAMPWLATAAAAMMPLLVGALVMRGLASCLDVPFTAGQVNEARGPWLYLWESVRASFLALDYRDWRTYAFLVLGFSICSELAPSATDLRRSLLPILVVAVVLLGATFALGLLLPGSAAWHWYHRALGGALGWLSSVLVFGILSSAIVGTFVLLPGLLAKRGKHLLQRT